MQNAKTAAQGPNNKADTEAAEYERETFAKLQTKLRLLVKDREVQRWQTRQEIQKQEGEIDWVMKEQDRLQRELGMRNYTFQQSGEPDGADGLRELMNLSNDLKELLDVEAHTQLQDTNEISDFELKLLNLRKDGGDPKTRLDRRRKTRRAERVLEDKLQTAVTRLNGQVTRNGELREETQTMHQGSKRFQRRIRALKKELREVEQQIKEASKQYLAQSEASVQSHQKRAGMREGRGKERAEYNADMQRLQLTTDHDQDLGDFLRSKYDGRESSLGISTMEATKARETEECLYNLKEVFNKICRVTGEDDLDELLRGFIQAEDQNFALFKFVNEQNKEIETLKDEIEEIEAEIGRFEVRRQQRKLDNTAKMEEISKQLQEVKARTAVSENQASDKNSILEEIEAGLNSIFSTIGCDSDSNFSSYLGAIEQRTNEMLTMKI